LDAVVLERERLDREKPCAGGVPIDTFSLLPEEAASVIEGWIEHIVFRLCDRREVSAALPPRTMAMVRRSRFDALLAARSGAELQPHTTVTALREGDGCAEAVCSDGRVYRGRYCILAAGGLSPFEQVFNPGRPLRRGLALVAEPGADENGGSENGWHENGGGFLARHEQTAFFEFGTVPRGYIWSFSKADRLSVGAGKFGAGWVGMPNQIRGALESIGVPGAREIRFRGHPVILPGPGTVLAKGRLLRAGEAAGLVDPLIGEGIRHAVRSGEMAAEAVIAGDSGRYERRCRREILRDLFFADLLGRLFYGFPRLAFHLGVENPHFLREFVRIFSGKGSYREMAARFPLYLGAAPFSRHSS
jgi:flavin-dependent dehydrogenase